MAVLPFRRHGTHTGDDRVIARSGFCDEAIPHYGEREIASLEASRGVTL
jgi:hypothetical protein